LSGHQLRADTREPSKGEEPRYHPIGPPLICYKTILETLAGVELDGLQGTLKEDSVGFDG
jgi:hypothetical protein